MHPINVNAPDENLRVGGTRIRAGVAGPGRPSVQGRCAVMIQARESNRTPSPSR